MNHPVSDMLDNAMGKIRELVDANTVVGEAIHTPEGVTIIPISKISIAFAGGGSDFAAQKTRAEQGYPYGGGSGCGVKVHPVAFLVIRGENVRLLPIGEPAATAADRVIDMLPELVDKVSAFLEERKGKKTSEI